MKRIRYKRYQNWKTNPGKGKEHEEILYYIEKIPESQVVYNAPFSFPGNKARLMTKISSNLPSEFQGQIVDAFGGGLNVGINIPSKLLVYNDHNKVLCGLLKEIAEKDTYKFILYINRQIRRFGLEAGNKDAYDFDLWKTSSYGHEFTDDNATSLLMHGDAYGTTTNDTAGIRQYSFNS